ncbi:hypothetical protein [Flavobacterium collinsii]|uniref:Uncharacterized protein n=1 Tax=Flavobacterium collinsii TaxID=1114861 RepID=A0ABM8KQ16_9FLAO|nr:hypothetical protein [Flavobacterium collinsii]CAA9203148.1 hypothetical protein FLACOL7796_04621 [Flavobacterium collinsii]
MDFKEPYNNGNFKLNTHDQNNNTVSNLNLLYLDFAEVVLFQNVLCHDSATKLNVLNFNDGYY